MTSALGAGEVRHLRWGGLDVHFCRPFDGIFVVLGESDDAVSQPFTAPGPGMVSIFLALSGDFTVLGTDMDEWRIPANTAAVMFRPSSKLFGLVGHYGTRLMVLVVHISKAALEREPFRGGLPKIFAALQSECDESYLLGAMPITREIRRLALDASRYCRDLRIEKPFEQAINLLALLDSLADAQQHGGASVRPIPARGNLEKLFAIKTLIDTEFAKPIRMSDLAKTFCLGASAMSQAFQAAFGVAPVSYLNQVRLRRAAELLGGSDATIGQIAWAVGYSHQGNFTVAFRRAHGVSPRQFRATAASHRGKIS